MNLFFNNWFFFLFLGKFQVLIYYEQKNVLQVTK